MKSIPVRKIAENRKEQASPAQFTIRDVRDLLGDNDLAHELHRHDFYFMLALQKGKGSHEIDFKEYKVVDNSVFFLRPGQVHQLQLKKGCTGYLMEFNKEFYHPNNTLSNQRLQKASNKDLCKIDAARSARIHTLLADMLREYTAKEEGHREVIKASLDILFVELVRQSSDPQSISKATDQYTQARFEEFTELLEAHIATVKQASQYASLLHLSLYQLNGITKAAVGKTSSELINEHILLEAKRYLLATPDQVKEIADHLGYEDVSYFTRFFKKHTGHTPEAFRHNCR